MYFTRKEIFIRLAFFVASVALAVGISLVLNLSMTAQALVGLIFGGVFQLLASVSMNP